MAEFCVSSPSTSYYETSFLSTSNEEISEVDSLGGNFSQLSVAALTSEKYSQKYEEPMKQLLKNAKFSKYYSEYSRMETFANWHFQEQTPEELAKAGFFSTGLKDEVYCFYCGGRLDDWTSDVLPWEEHALYFPRCKWLLQKKGKAFVEQIQSKQNNLPDEIEEQRSNPKLSKVAMTSTFKKKLDMSILENRIRSFEGCHLLLQFTVAEFAAAGFFYMGIRNKIKCYMCHIEVNDWKDGYSPFEIHQRNSPNCEVVTRLKAVDNKEMTGAYSNTERNIYAKTKHEEGCVTYNKSYYVSTIEDYKREYDRLLSFYHWPICQVVDRFVLAAAGFYWKEKLASATVQCFACFGVINEWKFGDKPGYKHKLLNPSCPFVMGMETGNQKVTTEEKNFAQRIFSERDALKKDKERFYHVFPQTSRYDSPYEDSKHLKFKSLKERSYELAKYPHFCLEMDRLKSFTSWPSHHCISLTTLAAAGFFSNNIEDQVTCFFCDGKLHQWKANDDPWKEHARDFPHCKWLLEQKGKQFVDNVQKKYESSVSQTAQRSPVAASAQRKLGRGEVLPVSKHNQKKSQTSQPSYDLGSILRSDAVQVLVDMGIDENLIRTVIQKRLDQGLSPYQNTEDLLSAVFEEDETSNKTDDSNTQHIGSDPQAVNPLQGQLETKSPQDDKQNSFEETENEDTQNELALLSQKLERLEEKNLCKICLDGEVDVLFLPCKHLIACKDCSEKLDECPICRTYIDEKVNVFMP